MSENQARTSVRLWPAVILVALQWVAILAPKMLDMDPFPIFMSMFLGPIIVGVCLFVWWLFASRVPLFDRFFVPVAFLAALGASYPLADPSFIPMGYVFVGLPYATTFGLLCLILARGFDWPLQRALLLATFALSFAYCDALRVNGVTGGFNSEVSYRWEPTAEDLLRRETIAKVEAKEGKSKLEPGDWPAFRGLERDGILRGVKISTDWDNNPPKELWRHRVGPGWSSFAVVGDRLFTQEQRDKDEVVVCYDTKTGGEVWKHADEQRFAELVAGPGPRATPTFHDGRIYSLGANGTLNCLDAATGDVKWSHDIKPDASIEKAPMWGFSASPLVIKDVVTVFAGGGKGKGVLAYKLADGTLAWSGGDGKHCYVSPQRLKINGVEQIAMYAEPGLTALDPSDGHTLWEYQWEIPEGIVRCTQPNFFTASDVLLGSPFRNGMQRVHLSNEDGKVAASEVWSIKKISPYYNDFVVYGDNFYGFENQFFVCASLADGTERWRERGYESGQVLLLADQGLLLIINEKGTVSLLEANAEKHKLLGKFKAIKGKTWNHPVIAHGKLFVRNGEEMACYELKLAE